jgi:hypothetical protein
VAGKRALKVAPGGQQFYRVVPPWFRHPGFFSRDNIKHNNYQISTAYLEFYPWFCQQKPNYADSATKIPVRA